MRKTREIAIFSGRRFSQGHRDGSGYIYHFPPFSLGFENGSFYSFGQLLAQGRVLAQGNVFGEQAARVVYGSGRGYIFAPRVEEASEIGGQLQNHARVRFLLECTYVLELRTRTYVHELAP